MDKKYELVKDDFIKYDDRILYRIRALKDFGIVKTGDLGGYVESEANLSHGSTCWIRDDAKVFGFAKVHSYAEVYGRAKVHGFAEVHGCAEVYDHAEVHGNAEIYGNAEICGYNVISGYSHISK